MKAVEENLLQVANGEDRDLCSLNNCIIKVDSEDEIGENLNAYNKLVEALAVAMKAEMLTTYLDIETLVKRALPQFIENLDSNAGMILVERGGNLL